MERHVGGVENIKLRQPQIDHYLSQKLSAAEKGQVDALYELGLLYSTGIDVDQDYIEAHKWLNLAAIMGDERAVKDRAELASEMTSSEVREALRQARLWMQTH